MNRCPYRFEFDVHVSMDEVEQTLHLALYSAEGLFGTARVRTEATYECDPEGRAITVDGSEEVGGSVVRIYTGLLLREFGEAAFRVRDGRAEMNRAAAHG